MVAFWGHNGGLVVGLIGMVSLEFNGLGADEIKRHPEVEVLWVTRDSHTEVMKKVLSWLAEEIN